MLFNSIEFIVFFAIVFCLYWFILNRSYQYQNLMLLVASYVFYGWWDWRFLSLIVISSGVDFVVGLKLHETQIQWRRKALLLISLAVNLGFLAYFKYFNFFIDGFVDLVSQFGLQAHRPTLSIILPVGISFYTFQTLSYTLDIYRRELAPTRDVIAFFTFVGFFPQLVAGPIERARQLLPQFQRPRHFDYEFASSGARLILLGFFKKMVIADSAARLVDMVYNDPTSYPGFPLVVATILFAFQIYCDFSGYSDIAIGTARILGFDLMLNFNKPYFSASITEFWRRWHISLSTWFRDYVYIPLGGSRVRTGRSFFNVFVTFCVSGLWHGANWTFIVWGAVHGAMLIVERLVGMLTERHRAWTFRLPRPVQIVLTFALVCFGWVFFRANSLSDAFFILGSMFSDVSDYTSPLALSLKFRGLGLQLSDLVTLVAFIGFLLLVEALDFRGKLQVMLSRFAPAKWALYYLILLFILFWGTQNTAENFIYFQF